MNIHAALATLKADIRNAWSDTLRGAPAAVILVVLLVGWCLLWPLVRLNDLWREVKAILVDLWG